MCSPSSSSTHPLHLTGTIHWQEIEELLETQRHCWRMQSSQGRRTSGLTFRVQLDVLRALVVFLFHASVAEVRSKAGLEHLQRERGQAVVQDKNSRKTYECVYIYKCLCESIKHIYIYIYTYIYIYKCTYIHTHIRLYVFCVYIYTCIDIVHIYVHIFICVCENMKLDYIQIKA